MCFLLIIVADAEHMKKCPETSEENLSDLQIRQIKKDQLQNQITTEWVRLYIQRLLTFIIRFYIK